MSTSNRLAAALAYQPTTACCQGCRRRVTFAKMDYCNRYCRRCWAAMCRQYRQVAGIKREAFDTKLERLWDWLGDRFKDRQQAEFWRLWGEDPGRALSYLEGLADGLRKQARRATRKQRRAA